MIWYVIAIIDNFMKLFQYAWFILIPIIVFTIYLIIKRRKIKKSSPKNKDEITKISKIITGIFIFVFIALLSVRVWGPNFYKLFISFFVCGKEDVIEEKLEMKYGRNFTFVSRDKIVVEDYAGDTLGQDVNGDYSVRYVFKDDDGVIALVEYKTNYQCDYYESKRSKYDIEKAIYDYAEEVNFDKKFYVYVESRYQLINSSDLNEKARENFILEERSSNDIYFILTEQSIDNKIFIKTALNNVFPEDDYVVVKEYIVSDDEYKNVVDFYDSLNSNPGIAGSDYEEDYDYNNKLHYEYYYIDK